MFDSFLTLTKNQIQQEAEFNVNIFKKDNTESINLTLTKNQIQQEAEFHQVKRFLKQF